MEEYLTKPECVVSPQRLQRLETLLIAVREWKNRHEAINNPSFSIGFEEWKIAWDKLISAIEVVNEALYELDVGTSNNNNGISNGVSIEQ